MDTKIEKNIIKILNNSSEIVGRYEEDSFSGDIFCRIEDLEIKSPIERALYIAMETVMRLNHIDDDEPAEFSGQLYIRGLGIRPQCKIGNYTVDFYVSYKGSFREEKKELLVECDSQEWHERTEEQRRYEKARDRYLSKKGHTVFHYTGSEILKRPYYVASEILEFVTGGKDFFDSVLTYSTADMDLDCEAYDG